MKILIVGADSYIGDNIAKLLEQNNFEVSIFDIKNNDYRSIDFVDVKHIIYVAGIVHNKSISDYSVYEKINVELPVSVASLAKQHGVENFIFFSSMSVYGVSKSLKGTFVNESTDCNPIELYGRSKLQAEKELKFLEDEKFKLTLLRPANVIGPGCRGEYISKIVKISKLMPSCPSLYKEAIQGTVFIENLTHYVLAIIQYSIDGVICIQDCDCVSMSDFLHAVCNGLNKKKRKSNFLWKPISLFKKPFLKLFGGISYSNSMLEFCKKYQVVTTLHGIERTIKND